MESKASRHCDGILEATWVEKHFSTDVDKNHHLIDMDVVGSKIYALVQQVGDIQRYALAVFSLNTSLDEFEYLDFLKHPTKLCFSVQSGIATFIDEGQIIEHRIGKPGHHLGICNSPNDVRHFIDCASSVLHLNQISGGRRYFGISTNGVVYSSKDSMNKRIELKSSFESEILKFNILKNNDFLVADSGGFRVFSSNGDLKSQFRCENLVNVAVSKKGFVFVAEETPVFKNKFTITLRDKNDNSTVIILLDEKPVAMDFCDEKLIVAFKNKIEIYV